MAVLSTYYELARILSICMEAGESVNFLTRIEPLCFYNSLIFFAFNFSL